MRSDLRKRCLAFRYAGLSKLLGVIPKVDVYVALNDPHSYMLIQALEELQQRFTVTFSLYLVYESKVSLSIEPAIWRKWAINDANLIARQYGFSTITEMPSANALFTGQQLWQMQSKNLTNALAIFRQTWDNDFERYYNVSTPVINFQIKNQQRLFDKGHYSPASIQYLGEWYVGVDRLSYLEHKLIEKGYARENNQKAKYKANSLAYWANRHESRCKLKEDINLNQPVEMFLSLRSPYSYVGFQKVKALCEFYQVPLILKPILPLVMRNVAVPQCKKKYIYTDAHREATSAGIPYKSFVDPIGEGIVKCFEVFAYAHDKGRSQAFIEAIFDAIYVRNIDVAIADNLTTLCHSLKIDYQAALEYGLDHDWQQWSDCNQKILDELGLWGVPCFRYGEQTYWGQDRLAEIEKAIIDHKSLR